MDIVLECSKFIQFDTDSIKNSRFDSVCIDYNTYKKIHDSDIKISFVKVNNLEMDIENLKCKFLIVEPQKWNYEECLTLGKKLKNNNIQVLFENSFINKNGCIVRDKFSNSTEIVNLVNKLNEELDAEIFGACVDIFGCTCCSQDIQEFIISLRNKVKAIRISGSDGYTVNRNLPFSIISDKAISADWSGMIRGLREIDFNGEIILDFLDSMKTLPSFLVNATFDFSYEIGKYIEARVKFEELLKKYKSIVLFGAGFMLGVYINCYGKKYPPIFACDNNKMLWGKKVRGIAVKEPEVLRSISNDTGVVICNSMYYREIQAQLLEMGIKNIEIFD